MKLGSEGASASDPDRRLRVFHIGQWSLPADGATAGIDEHVRQLGVRLSSRGIAFTAPVRRSADIHHPPDPRVEAPALPTLPGKHASPLFHAFISSVQAALSPHAIVHYHGPGPAAFSWIPKLAGKKIALTLHGLDWKRKKWGVSGRAALKVCERAAIGWADVVIAVSDEVAHYVTQEYAKTALRITNGAESNGSPPRHLLDRHQLIPDSYVLYLGRLVPEKRLDRLITAYHRLGNNDPRWGALRLVLAGESDHTDAYVDHLHALAGGSAHIQFTGKVSRPLKQALLRYARLFVLPSEVEGCPLALLEAMSAARPCLASNIPPHREIIRENRTGWFFDSDDPEGLARALPQAIDHPRRSEVGLAAARDVRHRWTWDRAADILETIYRSKALSSSSPRRS